MGFGCRVEGLQHYQQVHTLTPKPCKAGSRDYAVVGQNPA